MLQLSLSAAICMYCVFCAVHASTQFNSSLLLLACFIEFGCSRRVQSTQTDIVPRAVKRFDSLPFHAPLLDALLRGIAIGAALCDAEARRNQGHNVLTNKEIEKEQRVYRNEGVRGKMLYWMIGREAVKWRPACGRRDVPEVGDSYKLCKLGSGDDRAEPFRQSECIVCIHEKVNKTVHQHAAALGTGIIHDIQKQEECGGMMVQMQKANFGK